MIIASSTRQRYSLLQPHLQYVQAQVRQTLAGFADSRGWAVLTRVKALESVSEKIETGRFAHWKDLDDLVAGTLVVPTLAQEPEALAFLREVFVELRSSLRGSSRKPPDVFRFDNTRFIGHLTPHADISTFAELPYQIPFEIQIRTAFEHAWSVATPSLAYKSEYVSWERARLTAQLKATVEQLDVLIVGFEETTEKIFKSAWPEIDAKSDITAFFKGHFTAGSLPVELKPKDWTRFSDNVYRMVSSAKTCQNKRPDQIAGLINESMTRVIEKEGELIPRSISLAQYIFASMVVSGSIRGPFHKYVPLITSELEDLYSEMKGISGRFDYGELPPI